MGERIDYYDDPAAPPVNSIKPSASAFVLRDGAVLLTCRSDNGNWTMPGGAQDLGESLSSAQRPSEKPRRKLGSSLNSPASPASSQIRDT